METEETVLVMDRSMWLVAVSKPAVCQPSSDLGQAAAAEVVRRQRGLQLEACFCIGGQAYLERRGIEGQVAGRRTPLATTDARSRR